MPSDARQTSEACGATGQWRVGEARLDLDLGTIARHGMTGTLRRKTLLVLRILLLEPGRPVARARFIALVWPEVWVLDDSLTQCIGELRSALGPDAAGRLLTAHGRGDLLRDAQPAGTCGETGAAGRIAELEARLRVLETQLAALGTWPEAPRWRGPRGRPPHQGRPWSDGVS